MRTIKTSSGGFQCTAIPLVFPDCVLKCGQQRNPRKGFQTQVPCVLKEVFGTVQSEKKTSAVFVGVAQCFFVQASLVCSRHHELYPFRVTQGFTGV